MAEWRCEIEDIGPLTCRVVRATADGERPSLVAVLCHGFGAPGDDLVPIAQELVQAAPSLTRAWFVFPEAPLSLADQGAPDGRAWWRLDIVRLQMALAQGEFRDLRNERPPGLLDSRERLLAMLHELQEQTELPLSRFVLGGFSQGAMLAVDCTLQLPENTGGLVIWSGTLANEVEWRQVAPRHAGLRVVQSHGRQDPILPFLAAEWLRDLLSEAGLAVTFLPFGGMHHLSSEALAAAAALLVEAAGDR